MNGTMEEDFDFLMDKAEHNIAQLGEHIEASIKTLAKENVILAERVKELEYRLSLLSEHVDWVYEEANK